MRSIGPHLFECPTCGLISTDYPWKPEIYNKEYQEKYERYAQTDLGKRIDGFRWGFIQRYFNGHRTLLDYGCATGSFIRSEHAPLNLFMDGWDINPFSPYHKETSIIPMPADVVTAFDVIEHLPSPKAWIEKYRPKLLVLLTPNVAAVPKGFITQWRHFRPDEHLHYYGVESLRALFKETGYHLEGWDFCEGAHRNPDRPMDLITVAASRK